MLAKRSPVALEIGSDPCAASATVARHFWTNTRFAVVAAADDAEGAILGSTLAACSALRVPPRYKNADRSGDGIEAASKSLPRCRGRWWPPAKWKNIPGWIDRCGLPCESMHPRALAHRLVGALGRERIRNLVVARAPDERADVGRSAWLAPYVCVARGAAVVLVHAQAAAVAEADVRQLVERESLHPQTITVLADYSSIGSRNVEVDPNGSEDWPNVAQTPPPANVPSAPPPPHYTSAAEPFIPTQPDQLSTVGVGRLPLESLCDTSVMFARGLAAGTPVG